MCSIDQCSRGFGFAEQIDHPGGQLLDIARGHKVASLSVSHRLGHGAHLRGNHRHLAGHRFQDRDRVGFHVRAEDKHVNQRKQFGNIAPRAEEVDDVSKRQFPGERFQRLPLGPIADNEEVRLGHLATNERGRLEKQGVVLFRT
jgi:hypothetical protein